MATTYTYTITQGQVITLAFSAMGVYDSDSPPSAADTSLAGQIFNLMIKEWMSKNYPLWCVSDISITPVAGQTVYPLGPSTNGFRPLRIMQGRLVYAAGNQIQLQPLSRQEYNLLGFPSSTGTPNSYYYDPQLTNGNVYLYLTPDTNQSTNTVHLTAQRPIADALNSTDSLDFPIEWNLTLVNNLAARMCLDFGVPERKTVLLTQLAEKHLQDMLDFDQENTSTFFQPNMRLMNRRI